MASCYILYSERIDSFFIGFTTEPIEVRLERHNSGYYANKWVSRGTPWVLYFVIECDSNRQARSIEAHIKRKKSKQYILNLKLYPEMVGKLLEKYRDLSDC